MAAWLGLLFHRLVFEGALGLVGKHVYCEFGIGATSVGVLALCDPVGANFHHVFLHLVERHFLLAGMEGLVFELVRAEDDQLGKLCPHHLVGFFEQISMYSLPAEGTASVPSAFEQALSAD